MRALLILLVVVLLLAVVGWIRFHDSPQRSTISIEKEEIRQDTEGMVERGNEFLENTRQAVDTDASQTDGAAPNGAPIESPPAATDAAPPPAETREPVAQPPVTPLR